MTLAALSSPPLARGRPARTRPPHTPQHAHRIPLCARPRPAATRSPSHLIAGASATPGAPNDGDGPPADRDGSASAAASGRTAPTSFQSSSTRTLLPGVLPVLPFPPSEALTPGAALTLHLFEARYLALLDAALARPDRCFVHAVIGAGPAAWASGARGEGGAAGEEMGGTVSEWAAGGGGEVVGTAPAPPRPAGGPPPLPLGDGRAALRGAVLTRITSIAPAPGGGPGAMVTIRGEARLALTDLVGVAPFIATTAALALDAPPPDAAAAARLAAAGQAVEALMWDAINLTFKLPRQVMGGGGGGVGGGISGGAASLQAALNWVDHAPPAPEPGAPPPVEWRLTPPPPPGAAPGSPAATAALAAERGARLAFAALQDVPHSSPSARAALGRARLAALEMDDTAARLEAAAAVLRAARSALAAKAALHALALG